MRGLVPSDSNPTSTPLLLYQKESWGSLVSPIELVRKLYRYRVLLRQFTWRNVELQHKGSILGLVWSVLSPLLLFAVYGFVFVVIFNSRYGAVPTETRKDYAIALFLSLSLFQIFQETLVTAPSAILQNPNFVKKVVFPIEILPVSYFGAALFRCLVSLVLVVIACAVWGPGLGETALWLPVIVVLLGLLSLGVGWILAALGVFLRDLTPLMQFFSLLLMFMSAVFYSSAKIPAGLSFLRFNPMLIIVESGRDVLLWHIQPDPLNLAYLGILSIATCLLGHALFCAVKPAFADVL
jgi:lipopolysaccharide transport system permease protein